MLGALRTLRPPHPPRPLPAPTAGRPCASASAASPPLASLDPSTSSPLTLNAKQAWSAWTTFCLARRRAAAVAEKAAAGRAGGAAATAAGARVPAHSLARSRLPPSPPLPAPSLLQELTLEFPNVVNPRKNMELRVRRRGRGGGGARQARPVWSAACSGRPVSRLGVSPDPRPSPQRLPPSPRLQYTREPVMPGLLASAAPLSCTGNGSN